MNEALAILSALIDGWLKETELGRDAVQASGGSIEAARNSYLRLQEAGLVRFLCDESPDGRITFSIEPTTTTPRNRHERRRAARGR